MSGPAIRALEIGRELSARHEVRLVSTSSYDGSALGVETVTSQRRSIISALKWADGYVVQGSVTYEYPDIVKRDGPVVVDLYDPYHIELLEQTTAMGRHRRARVLRDAARIVTAQLKRGDFFMCSSQRQWDLWMGHLIASDRLSPDAYDADPSQRNLMAVVPFGIPPSPPTPRGPLLRERLRGLSEDAFVALWSGGIYDWLDPCTPVTATKLLRDNGIDARLIFMGANHAQRAGARAVASARSISDGLGMTDTSVYFTDWIPYDERQDMLLGADVGITASKDTLEAAYAFRTRLLDALWCGLPTVTSAGDTLGELMAASGAGRSAPIGDAEGFSDAIASWVDLPSRQRGRDNARLLAPKFHWPIVLAPLVDYFRAPRITARRKGGSRRTPHRTAPGTAALAVAYLRDRDPGSLADAVARRASAWRPNRG
jgi:glycosyltransferase involved in cell wall biosynthesis